MPHVQLRTLENGNPQLLVDGVDMTNTVARAGLSIDQPYDIAPRFRVKLELMPATVDIDLPDCLAKLIRAADKPHTRICNDADNPNHPDDCDCGNEARA